MYGCDAKRLRAGGYHRRTPSNSGDPRRTLTQSILPVGRPLEALGPYLSERAWGTVRDDYSPSGTTWDSLPHDQARSKVYRWGDDGIGGIGDRHQFLCVALALSNGRDPTLKERLFGPTWSEGNHGEDAKEYFFYLDSTLTHSSVKFLRRHPLPAS